MNVGKGVCVVVDVDTGKPGIDAEVGSGGGTVVGNGGCHVVGVDISPAIELKKLIWSIRAVSSCSALKSDTNGSLLT